MHGKQKPWSRCSSQLSSNRDAMVMSLPSKVMPSSPENCCWREERCYRMTVRMTWGIGKKRHPHCSYKGKRGQLQAVCPWHFSQPLCPNPSTVCITFLLWLPSWLLPPQCSLVINFLYYVLHPAVRTTLLHLPLAPASFVVLLVHVCLHRYRAVLNV